MTISYPLSLPTVEGGGMARIVIRQRTTIGVMPSPFTFSQQVQVGQGEGWAADIELIPMPRESAEEWTALLMALNGPEGTVLISDPMGATPRGSWAGASPLVKGTGQSGKSLIIDGLGSGATIKKGDWFQLGTGSNAYLHKVSQDAVANGSGEATLDFWPRLRVSPGDNDPLTIDVASGRFRLVSNENAWSIEDVRYGMSFSFVEAQ
jgi:hypothetical protein